ncbi:c-type cytochrome [Bradyrhizobium sp. BR 1433]|uniref:c-type cytochrome n=1 Tax=Bradyrhizobium sp. BR 1433 TaxID=3447967 RepID=UPI003EE76929
MKVIVLATLLVAAGIGQATAQIVARGEVKFNACKACHQVGDNARNAIGPTLNGLIGRKAGSVEGYGYSEAMKNSGITWTEADLAQYIYDPKAKVPGNKMAFGGLKDKQAVSDIIDYLHNFDKAPVKLHQ